MKFLKHIFEGCMIVLLIPVIAISQPTITSFSPSSGPIGTLVTITGLNLNSPTALSIGGVPAIAISNTGTSLVAMVMPGASAGIIGITTANGSTTSTNSFTPTASAPPAAQQGNKLVGSGNIGITQQGISVSISADGNTAIVGGYNLINFGAAWVYIRDSNGFWSQQGNILLGNDNIGGAHQGNSVSISADGNTAIIGSWFDNNAKGAAWIFVRNSFGVWTQQGNKLVGVTNSGSSQQGNSVDISADGNTAVIGAPGDSSNRGAVWVFVRNSFGVWTQQGSKLFGTGSIGTSTAQGSSVSVSSDGNTIIFGGRNDNNLQGAAWIFVRSGNTWSQQGDKLVGTGNIGASQQGFAVNISADGNTAAVGGFGDNNNLGAVWIYTRNSGVWTQQGNKLIGIGNDGSAYQGSSVSLSADGNTLVSGATHDNSQQGAVWVFTRNGVTWNQSGSKRVGSGIVGSSRQGRAVSISSDGNTMITGGILDNNNQGAVWVFSGPVANNNADLSSLILNNASLSPIFSSATTSYISGVDGVISSIIITPTSTHVNATIQIQVNGGGFSNLLSGIPSTPLALNIGSNNIIIKVTAQDGITVKTYSLTIIRGNPNITSFSPSSGPIGTLVTITGVNLNNPTALTIGGVNAIAISNTGTSLVAMVMPGANAGIIGITTANGSTTSANTFTPTVNVIPAAQQGNKLVGTNSVGVSIEQGNSVCISADGTTAIVGGIGDNNNTGAVWVYTRTAGIWSQQGDKLVGTNSSLNAQQGYSVGISADGNTAIVGGRGDNNNIGAAWIFIRTAGVWSQQGSKLVGSGYLGNNINQGRSVSISADGNTAIVGGNGDNSGSGAAWVFTRSGGTWTQQGNKLIGSGSVGSSVSQGTSVSISADGNTVIIGGQGDNSNIGAAWIFTKNAGVWTQQGNKLVGTESSSLTIFGNAVSISADGNTAIIGGYGDSSQRGAAWIFTRNASIWSQQGNKLVGSDSVGRAAQGRSVSISADGNTAVVGGYYDNNMIGATWIYRRNGGIWTQQGNKRVGTGYVLPGGYLGISRQGNAVSISADGNTLFVGGNADNNSTGAAWVFSGTIVPTILSSFTVDKLNTSALLKFTTLTEVNSDFIEVQHSLNAIDFTTLEKLIAKGNSTTASQYSFTNANTTNAVNYYRLKLVDKDGRFSYSEIRKVDFSSTKIELLVYPNPIENGILNIDLGEAITKHEPYFISTIDGKIVHKGMITNRQQSINISSLLKGSYLLKIDNRPPVKILVN